MAVTGTATTRRSRLRWLAAGVVILGMGAGTALYLRPRPVAPQPVSVSAPLPPLTTSPFLNTKPGVAYVGDQACAGCHRAYTKGYHQHPMGRSLFPAADAPPLEKYDANSNNPFQVGPFHFQVVRDGGKLIHREWCQDATGKVVAAVQEEMSYAVGSGTQARSYLFQRDGFLFESPITWFSRKSGWQISPGYENNQMHFTRRIETRCLFCHCQEARPVKDTINRYEDPPFGQLAIGCERCHGPGELHVASRRKDPPPEDVDYNIVNPRHLAPALREAICEQCHIQGVAIVPRRGRAQADYRPGLPLHEYIAIFVPPPEVEEAKRIVGHVEQMQQSACFTKSGGKFGCTSCHDPHGSPAPAAKVAFYTQRCRNCHGSAPRLTAEIPAVKAPDCSLSGAERTAAGDNCLACHMPRNPSSTTHLAVTDHRVHRRPDRPRQFHSGFRAGELPLMPFHRDRLRPDDEELQRDLALAANFLAELARADGAPQMSEFLIERALPLLDQAVARAPDDVPAVEARGMALFAHGQIEDALNALETALALAPDREHALTWAADVAAAGNRLDTAEKHARRLTEKYPYYPPYRERLAMILARGKAWPQALEAAEAAVRGDPFRPQARDLLIMALLENGNRSRAKVEFEALGVIDPAYQAKMRPRFEGWRKRR